MALDSISSKPATYQGSIRPVQKASVQTTSIQDSDSNNVAAIGMEEMSAAAKVLYTQQEDAKDSDKQNSHNKANEKRIKSAIAQANNKMKLTRTGCEFSYHEKTHRVSIKVFDKETQEVIREIPPEESLDMLEKFWEISGLLVDERR